MNYVIGLLLTFTAVTVETFEYRNNSSKNWLFNITASKYKITISGLLPLSVGSVL